MTDRPGGGAEAGDVAQADEGRGLVVASWAGTVVFAVVAVAATLDLDLLPGVVVVSWALFGVGVVAFVAAYLRAIGRSRYEAIGMGGLFFLMGSAPRSVRTQLLASFLLQVVIAVATSSIRIYTAMAFGVLVPMYGLGLMGLWGARHGTFPPRQAR